MGETATGWGNGTEVWKARWRATMRWRRSVEVVVASAGLTFTQWLVLDAAHELIVETADAVSQNQIAARVELDRATISVVMRTLEKKRLVDRGGALAGRAWRVALTARALDLLRAQAPLIAAASEPANAG